jgi:hypothetical protein
MTRWPMANHAEGGRAREPDPGPPRGRELGVVLPRHHRPRPADRGAPRPERCPPQLDEVCRDMDVLVRAREAQRRRQPLELREGREPAGAPRPATKPRRRLPQRPMGVVSPSGTGRGGAGISISRPACRRQQVARAPAVRPAADHHA